MQYSASYALGNVVEVVYTREHGGGVTSAVMLDAIRRELHSENICHSVEKLL